MGTDTPQENTTEGRKASRRALAQRAGRLSRWGFLSYRLIQREDVREALDLAVQIASSLLG